MLHCIAVCRSVLQGVAMFCNGCSMLQCVVFAFVSVCVYGATFCIVLQGVAVCCSVLQCVAVCCSVLQCVVVAGTYVCVFRTTCCSVLQCVAVCCSVLQCVAMVAVCCSVLRLLLYLYVSLEPRVALYCSVS